MYRRYREFRSVLVGGSIEPHWMADGSSFWYAEGAPDDTVIYTVDPKANTKLPLFDTARLRKALFSLVGYEPPHRGLPFDHFTFLDDERAVRFALGNLNFILQLNTYALREAPTSAGEEESPISQRVVRKELGWEVLTEEPSPDGRWCAVIIDHNLWLREKEGGDRIQLTTDGSEGHDWVFFGNAARAVTWWSPNSRKIAVKKRDRRQVPRIPILHYVKMTPEVEWLPRSRAGGPVAQTELCIMDIPSKQAVRVDIGAKKDQRVWVLGWRPDSSELLFLRRDRSRKKVDLMAADPETGATRKVLSEVQNTFVDEATSEEWGASGPFQLLADGRRFLWISERDGWNHLYLYDLDGTLLRRLTEGAWPVVQLVAVEEHAGWVYFTAHVDKQRPYDIHLCRVNLEGKELARLTEATGEHNVQFSPSKDFFVDTHSAIDRPPVIELRAANGTSLQTLSIADIDPLKEMGWRPPKEFTVKAADGKTDLYGFLLEPCDFDPYRKYPVVDIIYSGPYVAHGRGFVRPDLESIRFFYSTMFYRALSNLGFVVFWVDGRGTPERGKEFQDVVYGNFGRHEIPDHMAALKQLAEARPYMDLTRVGICGYSWGGYFALRALLLAPDAYHVGISAAAPADLNDYSDEVELWMGLPEENAQGYEYASNVRLVDNLRGKLLLIHGTSDRAAPLSETMKIVDALNRAGKPYDLLVLPGEDHFLTEQGLTQFLEAIRRYLREHLRP